jgi:predicted nucleotidyltransferase component of viral defense system
MTELSPLQKQTLEIFAESNLKDRFYWTGGTLLAVVYLHHRRSQDLDFFTDEPFSHELLSQFIDDLRSALGLDSVSAQKVFDRWEFFIHNDEELRLDFVYYNHPTLRPREIRDGLFIDSLDDIAANKLMAMLDRNELKDVFDLYFLLTKANYSPSALLDLVKKKFGTSFKESLIWSEALRKIKDLGNLRPLMLKEKREEQDKILQDITSYFTAQSKKFLDQILE